MKPDLKRPIGVRIVDRKPLIGLRRVALAVVVGVALGSAPSSPSSAQTIALDTQDWRSIDPLGGVCNEDLCRAFVELAKVMNGQTPDVAWLNAHKGTTPLAMFNSGGSENITVIVRTALYYWQGDPHTGWLWTYYNIQLEPGYPYFLDDEVFSSVYTHGVVGATIAVRAEAARRGHTGLQNRSSTFLRHYWAVLTLAAVEPKPPTWTAYNKHGTISKPAGFWWGYNLGLVGRRVYANGFNGSPDNVPGYGLQGVLLAMAVEHPSRAVTQDLRLSPAYWGGMRAAVEALGYTLNGNGKVSLQSKSIPPYKYGLTASQRTLLRTFISDHNILSVQDIIELMDGQQFDYEISILHTRDGLDPDKETTLSWWGAVVADLPGDVKGGPWAIVRAQKGANVTQFVTRSNDKWGNGGRGSVVLDLGGGWPFYSQVCAEGALPLLCLSTDGLGHYHVVLDRYSPYCWRGCGF